MINTEKIDSNDSQLNETEAFKEFPFDMGYILEISYNINEEFTIYACGGS